MLLHKTTFAFIAILFNSFLFSQTNTAVIDLVDFNTSAVYGPGSGVSVHMNPTGIFEFEDTPASDNAFVLEMSQPGGAFSPPIVVSIVNGFFTTTINGVIPAGTVAGNYRLRVKATKGMLADGSTFGEVLSSESAIFSVDSTVSEAVTIYSGISPNTTQFDCTVLNEFNTDPMFGSLSLSTEDTSAVFTTTKRKLRISNQDAANTYKLRRIDVINSTVTDLGFFTGGSYTIADNLPLGTYNFELEAVAASGTSSIYSAVFVMHKSTTVLANESSETICVGNEVYFSIDTAISGIGLNYRGSYYTINFGDGTPIEIFTQAEILFDNLLPHEFITVSCGEEGSEFTVEKKQYNKFNTSSIPDCLYQENGGGADKKVNTSLAPEALFEAQGGLDEICENQAISLINLSTLGLYGTNGCEDAADFYWEISNPNGQFFEPYIELGVIENDPNGWLVDSNGDGLIDITIPVDQVIPGCWTFRLTSINQDLCLTESVFPAETDPAYVVNVQAIPVADFEFLDSSGTVIEEICFGETVTFSDTSNIESLGCQSPTYEWTVFPDSGYTYVSPFSNSSQSPDVIFNVPGVYEVTQIITNLCGISAPITKQITILGDPTVDFPIPTFATCQGLPGQISDGFILDFLNNLAIRPVYSESPFEPTTFLWTITGPGVTAADYTFLNGTDASSDFPIIKFSTFNSYTITVEVDGNCANSNSDTLTFVYEQTPIITNTETEQEICSGDTTQLIQITSDMDPETIYSISITADPAISGYDPTLNSGDTIPEMVLTNSTNVPATLVYSVSPEVNSCQGATVNFTITVNPVPVIPNQTAEICSEETFTVNPTNNPPTTIVPANTTYTWTVVDNTNVTGEADESVSQSTISQTLTNTSNSVQFVEYTVIPTSGADGLCEGTPFTLTVQVDPKPSLDDVVLAAICSGETFNHLPVEAGGINGTDIVPTGTTYTWTVVDTNGLVTGDSNETTAQTSISQTLTNTSNVPQTLVYTVTPTSGDQGNCVGETFTITITVNPVPEIPNQTAEICSEETFTVNPTNNPPTTIVPANTTYTWTVVDNTNVTGEADESVSQSTISQTLTNTSNSVQFVEYTVIPTSGADGLCEGTPFTLTVQVDPKPSLDDVVLAAICSGETFNHLPVEAGGINGTDIVPTGTTYTWTVVDTNGLVTGDSNETTAQTSISQTLTNTSNVPQTLVYTVTPTSGDQGNCVGETFTITITVNPVPEIPNQTAEICSEETFTVNPTNNPPTTIVPANTTYTWTVVDNTNVTGEADESVSQSTISQTLTNTSNSVQFVEYTVIPTSGADGLCEGTPFTLTVQVDPKPSLDDVVLAAICSGETFNHLPVEAGGINGTDIVPTGTTYTWTVVDTNGLVTGDSNETTAQTSISQTLTNTSNVPQTLVYTVTPTSGDQGNCEGSTFTVSIDVNPTPTLSAIPPQTICGGSIFETPTFVSDVTGVTYTWVLTNTGIPSEITGYPSPSGTGNLIGVAIQNTGSDAYTLIYDISVNYEGCPGNTEQFSITVEPAPSVNFDILDQSVCSGGTSILVNLDSDTSPVDISWSIDPSLYPTITGINQLSGTTVIPAFTLSNSGSTPVDLIFSAEAVTTSAGSCPGSPVFYTITVNPAAEMDVVNNFVYCNGENTQEITFSTSITDGTTEYNWVIDTNIGLSPLTGTGPIPSFTAENITNEPIIATVTVDPVFSNVTDPTVECDGVERTFTITINPSPQITNTENSQIICSEEPSTLVEWTSSIVNGTPTEYNWTFVSATTGLSGFSTNPGTGNLPVFTNLANASNTIGELVYEVIPTSLSCTGDPFLYTIFINPVLAITNTETSQTLCSGDISAEVIWENTNATLAVDYNWELDLATVPAGTTGLETNGTGNLPAMTIDITAIVTANIDYIITPNFDGCDGTPFTYTLTVDPRPIMDPIDPQTICGGTAFTTPILDADVIGTDYSWVLLDVATIPATITGYPTDDTQALVGTTISNSGTTEFTLTYAFTPSFNGCEGPTVSFDITVNPSPVVDLSLETQEICSGSLTQSFTASSATDPSTTYQWNVVSNASALDGADPITGNTNTIPSFTVTNGGTTPIDIEIEVIASTSGVTACPGIPTIHTITVVPDPVITIDSAAPTPICIDGSISDIEVSTTGGTGTVSYEWYISDALGTLISIHPNSTDSTTFNPGIFTSAGQYHFVAVANFDGSGCDQSESLVVTVEVVEDPVLTAPLATQTICESSASTDLEVIATGGSGTYSYQWFSNTTNSATGGTPLSIATNSIYTPVTTPPGTVYYYCVVTTDASGCETTSSVSEVIVNEGPSISQEPLATQTVCLDGATTPLEVDYIDGVGTPTYQWYSSLTCDNTDLSNPISGETNSIFTPLSTAVGATNYFAVLTFADGGCDPIVSACALVTVVPDPVITIDSAAPTPICIDGSISDIEVSTTGGTGTVSYEWYISDALGTLISIHPNSTDSTTFNPGIFTSAGQYHFVAVANFDGSGCDQSESLVVTVEVVEDPVLTAPLATQTICESSASTDLEVIATGGSGTYSYQWFSNTTNSATGGTPLSIATNSIYTPVTTPPGTVYYYCVVTTDASGCETTSSVSEVIVNEGPSISQEPLATQTVCLDGATTPLEVDYIDGVGTPTYQWYSSLTCDNTDLSNPISGETNSIFTPLSTAVGATNYFAVLTFADGGCDPIVSACALVTVVPDPVITIDSAAPTPICIDGSISDIEVSTTGGTGTVSYEWYISDALGTLISIHPNSTDSTTFNPGIFTSAGQYHFVAVANFDGSGCDQSESLVVTVEVVEDPVLTAPLATQTICESSASTDLEVIATGGSGTYSYQWFSNTTNSATGGTPLSIATNSIYTPVTTPPGTVYYYCVVTTDASGCETTSSVSEVIVNEGPSISQEPLATQTVCLDGATTPLEVDYIDGVGTPTYQWYSSLTCDNTDLSNPISGETNSIFTPLSTAVGATNYFAVLTFADGGCDPIVSACALVTVVPDPVITIDSAAPTPICIDGSISDIEVSTTGGTGTVSYEWYISDALGTLISIHPNSTDSTTFNPGIFTSAGQYHFVAVANFDGSGCDQSESLVVTVEVVEDPVLTAPLATQTICESSASTDLEVIATGGSGTYSYQWFSNTTNSATGGTPLSIATNSIYTPVTTPPGTVYYYCVVTTDASGCETTSSVSEVIVNEGPSISQEPLATQTVCLDGATTPLEVDYIDGVGTPTYQWYSSLTCDNTDLSNPISGETNSIFTPLSTAVGATNYFAVLTFADGGCDPIVSACALVTVVPDPVITIDSAAPTPICIDGSISDIEVSTTGGTGTVSYEWYISDALGTLISIHPNSTDSTTFNPGIFTSAGQYHFVAVANFDGSGCDQSESLVVTVEVVEDPVLTAPLATQTICESSASTDLEVIATGGSGTYSYQWFSNTTNSATGGTPLSIATNSIYTPVTTPPGTVYYYCVVTTDASGCETTSSVSEVIVNEGPSISQEPLATQTVCLDGATTPLEVDYIDGVGTPTYQWYSSLTCDNTDLSNPISGETNSIFTPLSTAVGATNYFAVLTFADGGCDPIVSACALVDVGEIPVIDDVDVIICSEANFNVVPTNGGGINANDIVPTTTEYTWTVVAPAFISGASDNLVQAVSISQTLVNATNTIQEVVYTVTPISTAIGECVGNPFTLSVFVNPTPTIADKTLTLCSEEPFSFVASGDGSAGSDSVPANTTYTWTVLDNPDVTGETPENTGTISLDQTLINQTNTPQLVVYTITPESDFGCVGNEFTLTVTVDPVPFILDTTADICSGEAFTITPLNDEPTEIVPVGTTYTWTVSANANITGAFDVTVGENLISQTLINTNPLNVPENITYTVTPMSGVCEGTPFEIIVTVKPNPEISVSIPVQTACSGDLFSQVDFTSSVPNTTYQYELLDPTLVPVGISGYLANVTGTGDFFPALTLTNTTTDPFTLTYSVEPLSEGCNGTPVTFDITINPSPGIIFSETDQELCDLGTSVAVILTSASPNVNIQWSTTVPPGLLGVGVLTGTDEIPVYTLDNTTDAPIDLVFTAFATTNDTSACPGAEFTYTITVNPTTTIDAIPNQIICSRGDFADVFITSPTTPLGSLTYQWEVTSAGPNLMGFTTNAGPIAFTDPILGETIFNASNLPEDLVYTLTPFFNGCAGDTQEFTITVNPTPEIFDRVDTICSEDTFDIIPINGDPTVATIVPANTTYVWTVVDNPNVTGDSDEILPQTSISQTLVNETNLSQDVVYTITPISDLGCEGPTFELTVTVESRPIILDKTEGICSGDTFTVSPTDNAPLEIVPINTLYTWTVVPAADNAFVTGFSDVTVPTAPISQTLINLSDDVRIITYVVTPSSGTCLGLPFELEVTISPRPFIEDVVVEPICSEDTFVVSPQTGVPNANIVVPIGTTYTWTVVANPNVDGESDEIVPQTEISQTLTNTTSVTQTIEYTVTPLSTGCAGLTFQVFVDVKPRPFIVAGPQTRDTQCSGSAFVIAPQDGVPTADTIVPVGTQYTWVISTGNPNLTGWSDQLTAVDVVTQTLVNTSNTPQQIVYSITPEADGCVGPTFDAIITIEPKPFVSNVIQDLCDSTSYILSPVNGVSPDSASIIPDVTLYTWGPPTVTGGITGGSQGVDEAFFDTGVLENPTTNFQTAVFTVTPNYYVPSNLTTPQCIGDPFTVTITVSPSPEINEVVTNIACSFSALCEASIDISPVGIAPFTYNWTSLEGNPIADPTAEDLTDLCPGTYELAITDDSNCTYIFQYLVEPPTPVDFTLERRVDISCNNIDVPPCDGYIEMSLTGGTLPYALIEYYTETTPGSGVFDSGPIVNATNPLELFNACEGNYVMKVVDANGCLFVSDTVQIEQLNTPVSLTSTLSDFNGFNIDCTTANSGFISVDLSGGSGTYNYSFESSGTVLFDGTLITAPATILLDNLVAGDYTLTVEDPNCPNLIVQTYTLTEPTPLVVTATLVDSILCFGDLATYEVTATGGVPPYTGIGFVDVLSGPAVFVVTDSNGCSAQDTTVVIEPTQVLATEIVNDALCFEDEGSLIVTPTGGAGILTVSLFDAANVFMQSLLTTQGVAVQFDEFEGVYFYNVTDENNCEFGPIAITIGEPGPIEIVDTVVTQPDCNSVPAWEFNNGSICITITGGTNPFPIGAGWVDNGGGQWCLSGLSEGTYPLDVTDINGCPLFVPEPDVVLTRPPEITAFFTDTLAIDCATDTATQTNVIFVSGGVPPYEITWSGGVWDPATQTVMQTSVGGIYTAFVNDQYGIANGCPPIPFVLDPITFFDFGIADFTLNSLNSNFCGIFAIDDPVNFQNTSFGDIVNITWNFGDGSAPLSGVDAPTHVYNQLGEYTIDLTVEDVYGCFDTYSETIRVTKGYEIVLPNAFTPNGDGINDSMRPVFSCMTNVKMGIYDTWGSLLYAEEGDTIIGWDGTIDGNPVENGNYIMVVTAETFNGQVIEMNGPVTLIK